MIPNSQSPLLRRLIMENPSLQADMDPVRQIIKKRFGANGQILAPGVPDPATQMTPQQLSPASTPDPLESQLMALLQQKQSNPMHLYQPPMPQSSNERDVNSRSFLSGLVGGINSRGAQKSANKESTITNLLRLQEQKRYHDMQGQNMAADNARADTQTQAMNAYRDWQQTHGDAQEARLNAALVALTASRNVDDQRAARALAEQMRHDRAMEGNAAGNLAERRKENADGGISAKDISSPVSQYYRNIGEQLKAALPGDASFPAKRDAIDAWVAKQVQTAQMNEVGRRTGGGAAPAPAAEPTTGGEMKPSENPALDAKTRAYWKAKGY